MRGFMNAALAILLGAHARDDGAIGLPALRMKANWTSQTAPRFGRGVAKQKRAAKKARRVAAHRMACR